MLRAPGALDQPSLITKQVVRIGAKRGDFRVLLAAWDFDGRDLTRRWTFVKAEGTSFHQLRIVDVDQDGRDDIADGNYVVDSDGTLRYVVEGAVHGGRFHIGDLDPSRRGLEGYAIQQTEGGVFTGFPWYYYDAATGERLITGARCRSTATSSATGARSTSPRPPTTPRCGCSPRTSRPALPRR
ncbi:rhamnogalacturonan lyase family protein [Actinoplanes xinjiangensis]|uniref:Rhamnogalacturonan lyase family 11 C-terminal domain-containing protein n=1 Tax=Actinoplanes xinjiangensis TaxID=512350 RepID=A0A316FPA0_9ACTN|nr:hypothetical protein [Actinoplanes xinjiangensis]PWK49510.1 hypothetical protein BC793_104183 [Actinoplanes xinjiangensis]GIF37516.1 hypothetical protein Axi01nite_18270 [Actinoplanes xinjiangensis]